MIKRILVGIAGTPATPCKIEHTLDLALAHGAKVDVLSVIDVDRLSRVGMVPIGAGGSAKMMRDERIKQSYDNAAAAVNTFIERAKDRGIPYSKIYSEGDPFDILAEHWQFNDLCVLGLRGWFDHGVVPDPEDVLLRLTKNGVRPILAVSEAYKPIKRVLVTFHGTRSSAKAMKRFVQMRLWPDMHLHILCIDSSVALGESLLERAADYCRAHSYSVSTQLESGDPVDVILRTATQQGCDLIAMGVNYRQALLQTSFSRITLGVLQQSDVPVYMTH